MIVDTRTQFSSTNNSLCRRGGGVLSPPIQLVTTLLLPHLRSKNITSTRILWSQSKIPALQDWVLVSIPSGGRKKRTELYLHLWYHHRNLHLYQAQGLIHLIIDILFAMHLFKARRRPTRFLSLPRLPRIRMRSPHIPLPRAFPTLPHSRLGLMRGIQLCLIPTATSTYPYQFILLMSLFLPLVLFPLNPRIPSLRRRRAAGIGYPTSSERQAKACGSVARERVRSGSGRPRATNYGVGDPSHHRNSSVVLPSLLHHQADLWSIHNRVGRPATNPAQRRRLHRPTYTSPRWKRQDTMLSPTMLKMRIRTGPRRRRGLECKPAVFLVVVDGWSL
jgi:hypothetical protein